MAASAPIDSENMCASDEAIRWDLEPSAWQGMATEAFACSARRNAVLLGQPIASWRSELRETLGAASNVPVIATGHQCGMHHPGVLVKSMLVSQIASRGAVAGLDLVVDHDIAAFGDALSYPAEDASGELVRAVVPVTPALADVTAADHPVTRVPGKFTPPIVGDVADGLNNMLSALRLAEDAPSAAAQWTRALDSLRERYVAPMPRPASSSLLRTSLGIALVQEIARDPWRCAEAFNAALRDVPGTGMRPLLLRDDLAELPLWRMRSLDRAPYPMRERAFDGDAVRAAEDPDHLSTLRPRALLMTAIMRLAGCDLFVHGTGGHAYDRAMEAWIGRWLGAEPAPAVMATVTRRLSMPGRGGVTSGVARERAQEARRAWHDPETWSDERAERTFGAGAPGETKRLLLRAVMELPRRSRRRREAYAHMHQQLQTLRSLHVGAVERRARMAREAQRSAREEAILARRDWPFPLYGDVALERLRADVAAAVDGRATSTNAPAW